MAIEVVEKRKGTRTCGDCGSNLDAADISKCDDCGSENIKKSLVIVRKAVGDEDDDLDTAAGGTATVTDPGEGGDEEDEDEDSDDDGEEGELTEEEIRALENEEDDEEDDDEEEDEEVEDEDDTPPPGVKKADANLLGLEALNISTACAEDIAKVFASGKGPSAYEEVMVEFNNIMDSAAEKWFSGNVVSKSDDSEGHAALIRERVNGIISKENKMPRPKNFDNLDAETKGYIESLEGNGSNDGHVTKRYKDLPEEVVKSLEAADALVEKNEQEKWLEVAKSYKHFPGEKADLAKTLRTLSESSPEAFEELKKSLDAAEYNLSQSDIFKSYGTSQPTDEGSEISKRRKQAEELVEKGDFTSVEAAEVSLMGGSDYTPTNTAQ